MDKLAQKAELYAQLIKEQQDDYGFIDHKYCDSTLFSGLVGCVPEVRVSLTAAYDFSTGYWHRRPIDKPCHDPADPKSSTISRDMILGILWYALVNRRPDIAQSIVSKAINHAGFVGEAGSLKVLLTKCQIMPPLFVTALLVRNVLTGGRWYDKILAWLVPADVGPLKVGYQAHLQCLHIALRGGLDCGIHSGQLKKLMGQAERCPRNALFQILGGDFDAARQTLADEKLFPADRLPTAKDRKESWLWQRDDASDAWEPVKRTEVHHGGDYLFAYWLLKLMENK